MSSTAPDEVILDEFEVNHVQCCEIIFWFHQLINNNFLEILLTFYLFNFIVFFIRQRSIRVAKLWPPMLKLKINSRHRLLRLSTPTTTMTTPKPSPTSRYCSRWVTFTISLYIQIYIVLCSFWWYLFMFSDFLLD